MALYHDHCPMAQDNKGAMWLSETKEIRNPYFGDKMMTCGSVERNDEINVESCFHVDTLSMIERL